jgi:isoquinoline 1-oxidoreductase beta subunit
VPGVEQVVQLPDGTPPFAFHALGGLAVISSNTWAAFQGRDKLQIEWDYGANADYDSDVYREALLETVNKAGEVVRSRGNGDGGGTPCRRLLRSPSGTCLDGTAGGHCPR